MDFQSLFDIAPFRWEAIGSALLCGAGIGLERQLRGKPVGIRTASLICLGSYIFIAASLSLHNESTDPTRIIGQVVTGVGFLGAGVILARDGAVVGVTSAATIWMLAALGICVGIGLESEAIKLTILSLGILFGVEQLERSFKALRKGAYRSGARQKHD